MHVQPVDLGRDTVTCPVCRVLQNADVAWNDEERDLMAGQRCWYCGSELQQENLARNGEFKVVVPVADVPTDDRAIAAWEQQLEHEYGSKPVGYSFDNAGRCVVTMHPVTTGADLDLPTE